MILIFFFIIFCNVRKANAFSCMNYVPKKKANDFKNLSLSYAISAENFLKKRLFS